MLLGDFHIHSSFSDGRLTIPEIVDYFGSRGFGAIAITDHLCEEDSFLGKASAYLGATLTRATFPLYREILKSEAERAWDQYGMRVIAGLELTKNSVLNHRSAHLLALGVDQFISADGPIEKICDAVHEQGGLVIAAHPVWTQKIEKQTFHLWSRRSELVNKIDAWEVASGPHLFPAVEAAGLKVIANSDFHSYQHMTSWKTTFDCSPDTQSILDAILKQKIGRFFYQEKTRHDIPLAWNDMPLVPRLSGHGLGQLAHP